MKIRLIIETGNATYKTIVIELKDIKETDKIIGGEIVSEENEVKNPIGFAYIEKTNKK